MAAEGAAKVVNKLLELLIRTAIRLERQFQPALIALTSGLTMKRFDDPPKDVKCGESILGSHKSLLGAVAPPS